MSVTNHNSRNFRALTSRFFHQQRPGKVFIHGREQKWQIQRSNHSIKCRLSSRAAFRLLSSVIYGGGELWRMIVEFAASAVQLFERTNVLARTTAIVDDH
jgi:hypothetical protein